jgi:hypothetical protein
MSNDANPMTIISAITRDHGDLDAALNEATHELLEARRRYLEAKRRYSALHQLACLRRIAHERLLRKQNELDHMRHEAAPRPPKDAVADPSRRDQLIRLQKLKELIQVREELLRRQRRALHRRRQAAAAQCQPDQAMRDNIRRLQKLKELFQLYQARLYRQHRAAGLQDQPGMDACRPVTHDRPASAAAVNCVQDTQIPASPHSEENIDDATRGPPDLKIRQGCRNDFSKKTP